MKIRVYLTVFCFLNVVSSFSQSQTLPEHLQGKMTVLLDSSVTQHFGNQVYMDLWERLWFPHNHKLVFMDLLADTLDLQFVDININANIHDICWLNNGNMIVALDSLLILLDDDGYTEIALLPYSGMSIEAAGDSSIYIFGKVSARNEYDVSLFDMSGSLQRLFSTKEKIVDIAGNGKITILVLSKDLILFSHKVNPTVFFTLKDEIQSIAITDYGGFFIATSNSIYYFEDINHYYLLSKMGAKKLWYRNEKLYILFTNGNLAVLQRM